jgi:hypothetical protein
VSIKQPTAEPGPLPVVKMPWPSGNWRAEIAALAQDIHYSSRWFLDQRPVPGSEALVDGIDAHLDSVRLSLSKRIGTNPSSILGHLTAAQEDLLSLAPLSYVRGCLPSLVMRARRALHSNDLQLTRLQALEKKSESNEITEDDRQVVVACLKGTNEQIRRAQSRLQSFRNTIVLTASFLLLLVLTIAILGYLRPTLLPICFGTRDSGVAAIACPAGQSGAFREAATADTMSGASSLTPMLDSDLVVNETVSPSDIALVVFIGFVAASLAAAFAIRNIRGSSDPYSIPLALAYLKLPTGALTALLGLVLIRAGLVPGIKSLTSTAEIIAWALVFGFTQQLFTGVVDRQAQSVLEQSGATSPPVTSPPPSY